MKSMILRAGILLGCALLATPAGAAEKGMSIKEATKHCEAEIPKYCVSTTCQLFCAQNKKIPDCAKKCTLQEFCKLKPQGKTSGDTAKLDADNNDKLMACIAEKRDPEGKTSGRRMEPWQQLGTYKMPKSKL